MMHAKLFTIVDSIDDQFLLQTCLNNLALWCDIWDVKLNVSKCNVVQYKFKNFNWDYKIQDIILLNVPNIKDLGVVFENNFKFSIHISDKISIANRMLGLLKRNFGPLTPQPFLLLYKTLVRPHLEYAACVWMPYDKNSIKSIEGFLEELLK